MGTQQPPDGRITPKSYLRLYWENLGAALGPERKATRGMREAIAVHGDDVLDVDDTLVKVWSDPHFGHDKIIGYTNRPFPSVHEMNEALWANWQTDVAAGDTLVCLGDVALGRGVCDETWERLRAAPGQPKILVVGNHDLTGRGLLRVRGFDRVRALLTSSGDPPLLWTHAPLPTVPAGYVNIHGHMHRDTKPAGSPHINVSVEQIDYRPVALTRLRRLARALVAGECPAGHTTLEQINAIEASMSR